MRVDLIDGIHVHYQQIGDAGAPLVVLINSLGTDLSIWNGVLECLGESIQSICYDKRGHGLSDAPPAPYTLDNHIDDLTGLLDQLGVSQAILCGVSVGGMIALGLAARRPDMVRGLILCDTAHAIGSEDFWNQRIEAIRRHGIESIADSILERWFSPSFRRTDPEAVAGWRNMLLRTPVDGYVGTCTAIRDADLTETAKSLNLPVRCLCGSEDGATPPDLVRSMSDLIAGSRFQRVDGAGHLPCIERPDQLAAVIRELIEETIDTDKSGTPTTHESGRAVRRAVLGEAHVDRAEQNTTDLDADFQEFITEAAWGSIWAREHLTRRERSMLTIAMLASLGHLEELTLHLKATANTGASMADVREVLMQVAVYAGIPAANAAFRVAKKYYENK